MVAAETESHPDSTDARPTWEQSLPTSNWYADLLVFNKQLQSETLLLAMPGLAVVGLVLLGTVPALGDPTWAVSLGLGLFLLAGVVWLLSRWRYLAGALALVTGTLAAVLLAVHWGKVEAALCLLSVPSGLATLLISRKAGIATVGLCSLLLLVAPSSLLNAAPTLRVVALLGACGTVGMILLTLRPLLMAAQWAWSGYERSQQLLEQARDRQVRLHETLEDLTAANLQLTRLNQEAQELRHIAEEERRAKEQFVANVSHELRTPLNMIIGFCEMITQAPETYGWGIPPALLADLAVVLRNSEHLSSLIDDVLDLSQADAGHTALLRERVPLADVVESAAVAVRPLFASKDLYLKTEVPDDLPPVHCDRTRIREVLLNLLSNAGRFTQRGGVRVRAQQKGGDVVVSVADTGPGIAEQDRERLFQPFQQLDGAIHSRFGGTGLGLSISRRFVEMHGGSMWVESTPGEGATFFFRLPIDPPVPLEAHPLRWLNRYQPYEVRTRRSRLQPAQVSPRTIVVEGGKSMQRLLARYLDGTEVIAKPDLGSALSELAEGPGRALIVNTPSIAEAMRQVRESGSLPYGVPAIVCSLPGTEDAAGALGAADYLIKPVSCERLLGALSRLGRPVSTVLVADDEPDALQLFARMLSGAGRGYRVLRASDGRQALELLRRERPDVVLLDLVMPEMDGFQFLAATKQEPPLRDIPVILVSARDPFGRPIVSDALAVTCRDGLSVQELLACVEALTGILSWASSPGGPVQRAVLPG